ncbi:ATP-binding cassette domain-containing protein [Streptomyces boncukensis]|uniref:ABC-type xenobiotic transporter n=1 Tax=Streptomyces boncukensis TaxID=2711219 RepID=A0A6G4WY74_9ACTN|nr:ATP-binding cassette domain-containing protein [Streptomyces boncukensis]NGO70236.1 ATP-binding cassette domain-containing protein [Streptomyces boncukensis]
MHRRHASGNSEEGNSVEIAIQATGLGKRYGQTRALDGVGLEVRTGTVLGLLGHNGAGKTTTVRILATLLEPDSGSARVAGFDVVREPREVRRRIGLAGQYAAVDELLTGRENLALLGTLLKLGRRRARSRAEELLASFELEQAADRPVRTYSGGMRRRLDLAACLISSPQVLFLDEPTTGLDPASRMALWRMVREQVELGVTVLLTTQYLEEADSLADRIMVFGSGQVLAEGTADELKRKVGQEWLEISLPEGGDATGSALDQAVSALAPVSASAPTVDASSRTVALPVGADRTGTIAASAAALEARGVEVADFALRRPSLDDVFFQLTGEQTPVSTSEEKS